MTGQARLQFDVPVKNHRQTVLPQACMSLIIRRFVKGRVLPCKRPSFIGQKVTFQRLKGNLLGSSAVCLDVRIMKCEKPEFEILVVPKAVCASFENLNLVVDALDLGR